MHGFTQICAVQGDFLDGVIGGGLINHKELIAIGRGQSVSTILLSVGVLVALDSLDDIFRLDRNPVKVITDLITFQAIIVSQFDNKVR